MINVERLRRQVKKAIDAVPIEIVLKRLEEVDDGYGGNKTSEVDVKTLNVMISFNKSSANISINDAGENLMLRNMELMSAYDPTYEIKQGDYFDYQGFRYKVTFPINNFNAFWKCSIEVV